MGAPSALLFQYVAASGTLSLKSMWLIVLSIWIVLGLITPLLVYREGDFVSALAIGTLGYSLGFAWYFSVGFPAFESMVPRDKVAQFSGVYGVISSLGAIIGPLIYGTVVQATNDHRLAFLVLPAFAA